jgi:hypothetical protein
MTRSHLELIDPEAMEELAKPLQERDGSKIPPVGAFVSESETEHTSEDKQWPTP